jgi:hypothetical protein
MARVTVTKAPTPDSAVVFSKNHNPALLKGAMGVQDFNKRTTATKPIRGGGRMLAKGRR